jgi:two-component system, chemotaxis family, response regulator PixG
MSALLGGQSTLRDLGVQMKRQVVEVATALLPYIQTGVVELVDLPDLSVPNNSAPQATSLSQAATSKPVIACIDDSPLICEILEQIVVEANCECVKIQDPLRAIATLLQHQPDLIFLDLIMPNLNGYEICTRLRKISAFRNTPIVLLSGNLIDRMRAKVVGASECLDKPVNPETVLKLIDKYLSPTTVGARSEG